MNKTYIISIICFLILSLTGCTFQSYPLNEDINDIVNIEIIEAKNWQEYTVLNILMDEELTNFLEDFSDLKYYQGFGDPKTCSGMAIKINYESGNYELLTAVSSEYVKDGNKWFTFKYCDREKFGSLIEQYNINDTSV